MQENCRISSKNNRSSKIFSIQEPNNPHQMKNISIYLFDEKKFEAIFWCDPQAIWIWLEEIKKLYFEYRNRILQENSIKMIFTRQQLLLSFSRKYRKKWSRTLSILIYMQAAPCITHKVRRKSELTFCCGSRSPLGWGWVCLVQLVDYSLT